MILIGSSHNDCHIFQIGSQHERLISGRHGIQQQIFTVGNHPGRNFLLPGEKFFLQFIQKGTLVSGPVSPGKNCHFTPFLTEDPGKDFHHRSLSRSAAGKIADFHHQTADGTVPDDPVVIHPEPELYSPTVETGSKKEKSL